MRITGLIDPETDSIHDAVCLHSQSISISRIQYRLQLDYILDHLFFI